MSDSMLASLEGLGSMGLFRCTVKCSHMLMTVLHTMEEVTTTAEEDMKHVLSYVGYMALDCRTASGVWKSKINLRTKQVGRQQLSHISVNWFRACGMVQRFIYC